eukprot:1145411-Pelagomonas_calceolata.AAC.2
MANMTSRSIMVPPQNEMHVLTQSVQYACELTSQSRLALILSRTLINLLAPDVLLRSIILKLINKITDWLFLVTLLILVDLLLLFLLVKGTRVASALGILFSLLVVSVKRVWEEDPARAPGENPIGVTAACLPAGHPLSSAEEAGGGRGGLGRLHH